MDPGDEPRNAHVTRDTTHLQGTDTPRDNMSPSLPKSGVSQRRPLSNTFFGGNHIRVISEGRTKLRGKVNEHIIFLNRDVRVKKKKRN